MVRLEVHVSRKRKSGYEQMLRVCAGLRLCRNAGGESQSPLRILRGFSTQFLAPDDLKASATISMQTAHSMTSLQSGAIFNRYHGLFVSDFTHFLPEI